MITRRTARFREYAEQVEALLEARHVHLTSATVDKALNELIEDKAKLTRLAPRTSFQYAPDDWAEIVADTIVKQLSRCGGGLPFHETAAVISLDDRRNMAT